MARIINCILVLILVLCSAEVCNGAKILSDKEKNKLCDIVKEGFVQTQMTGTSIRKIKRKHILVSIVEVKKTANSQRVAQVKAARDAGEFLNGAVNHSVTVYESEEGDSYDLKDKESGSASGITQHTSDISTRTTEENFSDKIVQSALTQVKNIQPLCKISSAGPTEIYAFYMIVK